MVAYESSLEVEKASQTNWHNVNDLVPTVVSNIDRSNIYQQYRIGFGGIRYDINPIISIDIEDDIADITGTDGWY